MLKRSTTFLATTVLLPAVVISISCGAKDIEHGPMPLALTPGISQNLARTQGTPSCVVDNIGRVSNPAAQKTVQVSGDTAIAITGWAIDEVNKATAGGVDVVIDMAPYRAHYGTDRADVATHFNHPEYHNSGFDLSIPPGQLSKGPHSVSIHVIASDKKSYYQGPVIEFAVN